MSKDHISINKICRGMSIYYRYLFFCRKEIFQVNRKKEKQAGAKMCQTQTQLDYAMLIKASFTLVNLGEDCLTTLASFVNDYIQEKIPLALMGSSLLGLHA